MIDYLIVGAGLFGATCARLLADAGKDVLVIEQRDHIGGNCYDELYDGVLVNRHGGHIFHTNSKNVWDFANRFACFRFYEHRVKAYYKGRVYSFPPNRMTLEQIGAEPGPVADRLIRKMFFEGYTAKQWGRPIEEVPESVIKRIPIRSTYDDRYFSDRYQGLPEGGYTAWIGQMLAGVPVELKTNFLSDREYWSEKAKKVIYSGPIDAYYGYDLGCLEYRSLEFETQVIDEPDYQGCPAMNYTEREIPHTRIIEWQHFGWRKNGRKQTLITLEYPRAEGEPYYPIGDEKNLALYKQYATRARAFRLHAGGRLGSYKYLNMDQTIAQAMKVVGEVEHA